MSCAHDPHRVDSIPVVQCNQRSSCKISRRINIVRTPIVYDEPTQTLYLSNLFSNLSLQHLDGLSHRRLLIFEFLGNSDSIFLELSILSIL